MKIDSEFKNLIPPLTEDEYKQLEENILRDGIRDPLVVWDEEDILVDGHNRYEISKKHPIGFEVEYVHFTDRNEAKAWIIHNQSGRRNLTAFQRSELALKLKPIIAEQARTQTKTHTDQGYQKSDKAVHTAKEIAKVAGVSHDTVHKVGYVLDKGSDETKQLAREGKISTNEAYKRTVKENMPTKPDPYDAKAKHHEFEEAKSNKQIVSMEDIESDKNNQRIIALDLYQAIRKVASGFEVMSLNQSSAELAEDAKGLTQEERNYLITQMYSVKNYADTIIKVLQGDTNGKR